jgi:hydrogenase/urease accessory protein HupE
MKPLMRVLLVVTLGWLGCAVTVSAHDARPAYLEINQVGTDRYDVLWRTPVLSGMRLPVVLRLPADARNIVEPAVRDLSDSLVERRVVEIPGGLRGKRIEFPGLQATITDVLARVKLGDTDHSTTLVRPSQPWIEIAVRSGALVVASAYLVHGIDHILLGYDHLLFVLALILIVRSVKVLLWTVTAFTVAHSITLALATLGLVNVPGPPVEATIALSIVLLASEIMRMQRGQSSLTARWPWVVAFSFGLLHGFGFAGALAEIGLPHADIPLALFAFNVGVEFGQLMFIGAVLAVMAIANRIAALATVRRYAVPVTSYAIGSLAAFWFVERVAAFVPA